MRNLYFMVGLPASGKSFYIKQHKIDNDIVVSTDQIRKEIFDNINDQKHNGEVFNIAFNRIREGLKSDHDVWFDATNVNRKKRENLIKSIRSSIKVKIRVVCYLMATPVEMCFNRNEQRERVVPKNVIDRMYKHFQVPYYSDGFDKIVVERVSRTFANQQMLEDMLEISCSVPHDNPHHSETIGNHMLRAEKMSFRYERQFEQSQFIMLHVAARYHDIGKIKVKDFKNIKGEPTKEAHYYYHQNVGSYDFLCYYRCGNNKREIQITMLIGLHMDFYGNNTEKMLNKYSELAPMLAALNNCDRMAH